LEKRAEEGGLREKGDPSKFWEDALNIWGREPKDQVWAKDKNIIFKGVMMERE